MKRVILGENLLAYFGHWLRRDVRHIYVAIRHRRGEAPHLDNLKNSGFVGVDWLKENFPKEFAEMVLSDSEVMEISNDELVERMGQGILSL